MVGRSRIQRYNTAVQEFSLPRERGRGLAFGGLELAGLIACGAMTHIEDTIKNAASNVYIPTSNEIDSLFLG